MQTEYAWICNYQFIVHVHCSFCLEIIFYQADIFIQTRKATEANSLNFYCHIPKSNIYLLWGMLGTCKNLTVPSCSNLFSIHYTYLAYIITLKLIFAKCHFCNSLYNKGLKSKILLIVPVCVKLNVVLLRITLNSICSDYFILFTAKQLKRRNSKRRKKFPNLKNHHCRLALIHVLTITLTRLHHGCLLANIA